MSLVGGELARGSASGLTWIYKDFNLLCNKVARCLNNLRTLSHSIHYSISSFSLCIFFLQVIKKVLARCLIASSLPPSKQAVTGLKVLPTQLSRTRVSSPSLSGPARRINARQPGSQRSFRLFSLQEFLPKCGDLWGSSPLQSLRRCVIVVHRIRIHLPCDSIISKWNKQGASLKGAIFHQESDVIIVLPAPVEQLLGREALH